MVKSVTTAQHTDGNKKLLKAVHIWAQVYVSELVLRGMRAQNARRAAPVAVASVDLTLTSAVCPSFMYLISAFWVRAVAVVNDQNPKVDSIDFVEGATLRDTFHDPWRSEPKISTLFTRFCSFPCLVGARICCHDKTNGL